ncbi:MULTISPECIES: hypothetical protein [Thiomicrorhabdus]|uniref:General glycosylation pathway protein n=1 Tax=Thiomicrorhabdus heinhorstiae TaxID=2748010 RepID=A0ABS0BSC6_9GAMM|nr:MULTISPECIES: hypothetical protein [Thiomicrorhabdus]MBF6056763.1 hypothetical protein [Thiomicrorhabdus heinhorstiae]
MKEYIELYELNKGDIEKFLIETIRNNGQYISIDEIRIQQFYHVLPSLELVYITDKSFQQISANIFHNKRKKSVIGKSRDYLVAKVEEKEQNVSISAPYISSATGESCVTVMLFCKDYYYFFDFNLVKLLMRFGLVERHEMFNSVTKFFYLLIGISLMFFSIISIGYAFYDYVMQLLNPADYTLESVFKPIIALTMGLAIFDLAKTLLEREVIFKAYSDKKDDAKLLTKFLTAIIIALSIEALMVVFKVALHDPAQMLYALYLIIGVALIIVSLAFYNKILLKK